MLVFMHDFLILKISESDIFGISEEQQKKKGPTGLVQPLRSTRRSCIKRPKEGNMMSDIVPSPNRHRLFAMHGARQ